MPELQPPSTERAADPIAMPDYDVRMVVLATDDLDESIRFCTETL